MLLRNLKVKNGLTVKNHTVDNDRQAEKLISNARKENLSISRIKNNVITDGNINVNIIYLPVSSNTIQKWL